MTTDPNQRREDFDRLLPQREAEPDEGCRRGLRSLIDAVEDYLLALDEKRRRR
jgi:hypothetical protein